MTAQTRQWVKKVEGDFDVVLLLRRSRKRSRYDAIRFHCQQCSEKYLKARLQEEGIRFPRSHDLVGSAVASVAHGAELGIAASGTRIAYRRGCRISLSRELV